MSGNWFFAYDTAVNSSESDTLFTVKSGDYLYYSNMYDSGKLYRKNINTGIEEKICEDSAAWIYVHDGYIYYKNISDGRKAYRLPVDSDYVITGEIAE